MATAQQTSLPATQAPTTTKAPTTTTHAPPAPSAPSGSSSGDAPCPLPPTCDVTLEDVLALNDPRLVITVAAPRLPVNFSQTIETLLCLPPLSVQVFEFKPLANGNGEVLVGIQCDLCVTAYQISFLQCFIDGPDDVASASSSQGGPASKPDGGYTIPAPLRRVGIVLSRVVASTISTANTTNHAAPSDNLTPATIAVVSAGSAVLAAAIAGAVVLGISFWKRKEIAAAISRFTVAFVHPPEAFPDAALRPGYLQDDDDGREMTPSKGGAAAGGGDTGGSSAYVPPAIAGGVGSSIGPASPPSPTAEQRRGVGQRTPKDAAAGADGAWVGQAPANPFSDRGGSAAGADGPDTAAPARWPAGSDDFVL